MRTKIISLALIALFLTAGYALPQGLTFRGYGRTYLGVLTEDGSYSIQQNTLDLKLEHKRDKTALYFNPYLYQYPDRDINLKLRQAYLDIYFGNIDIRLGKQQIIWGKADGVFITDIISPKDLSEFLLPDFEEIRIGVDAVKLNYYRGDHTFELVWMPRFQPTIFPGAESYWAPKMMAFPMTPTFDYSNATVESKLENSELALKYSALTSVIDFEIMSGYLWDDNPTYHVRKTVEPVTQQLAGITVTPEHHRLSMAGGSFSATLGAWVLRGEGAFYRGKYFNSTNLNLTDGVVIKDYFHYLVGLEYSLWDFKLSGQFIQEAILDYETEIYQDQFQNTATFLASRDFLRETLNLQLFVYYGFNNEDALIRPKLSYDFTDGFEILLGANIFTGNGAGMFEQYDNNDMMYAKVKYSF
ncbi:MAG: hypothetical protein MUC94_06055 [bacterium]|jgi:hypothetical protein|nr:hypothetical protein [bacterium]